LDFPAAQLSVMAGQMQNQISLVRFGDAIEIAEAAVFFASDKSTSTVGSEL
jgi:NAD(P)-dependent dehydrogenase (short-subunit alcohol dehydrogenase family)